MKVSKSGVYSLRQPTPTHYAVFIKFRTQLQKEDMPPEDLIQTIWVYSETLARKLDTCEGKLMAIRNIAKDMMEISKKEVTENE